MCVCVRARVFLRLGADPRWTVHSSSLTVDVCVCVCVRKEAKVLRLSGGASHIQVGLNLLARLPESSSNATRNQFCTCSISDLFLLLWPQNDKDKA